MPELKARIADLKAYLADWWNIWIRYNLTKLEIKWFLGVGHRQFDDGSYRFFWFILLPDRCRGDYHQVIREFETFLVWRIGAWFLIIR